MKRAGSDKKHGRRTGFKFSHAIKHAKLFNNPDGTARGFLATFETRLITAGITEALEVLAFYADRLYGPAAADTKRFCVYDAGVCGLAAIRAVDPAVEPRRLAAFIADSLAHGPVDAGAVLVARTKSLQRLQPVDLFCAASPEALRLAAAPLLAQTFASAPESAPATASESAESADPAAEKPRAWTFAVATNTRGNSRLTRDDAITTVTRLIATPPNTVDLKAPQITVVLDVFKSACAVVCIPDYAKYRKFNVRVLLGDRVPKEMLRKPKKVRKLAPDAPQQNDSDDKKPQQGEGEPSSSSSSSSSSSLPSSSSS